MVMKIHLECMGWIHQLKIRSSGRLGECSVVSLGSVKVGNFLSSPRDGLCCME
jgi:hypothetical protein